MNGGGRKSYFGKGRSCPVCGRADSRCVQLEPGELIICWNSGRATDGETRNLSGGKQLVCTGQAANSMGTVWVPADEAMRGIDAADRLERQYRRQATAQKAAAEAARSGGEQRQPRLGGEQSEGAGLALEPLVLDADQLDLGLRQVLAVAGPLSQEHAAAVALRLGGAWDAAAVITAGWGATLAANRVLLTPDPNPRAVQIDGGQWQSSSWQKSAHLLPLLDEHGRLIGLEGKVASGGGYRWWSGGGRVLHRLLVEAGAPPEEPIAFWRPANWSIEPPTGGYARIVIAEGKGLKPRLIAQRWGTAVIAGGGSARAHNSPLQLQRYLKLLAAGGQLLIAVDSGWLANEQVSVSIAALNWQLREWGYEPKITDWGQHWEKNKKLYNRDDGSSSTGSDPDEVPLDYAAHGCSNAVTIEYLIEHPRTKKAIREGIARAIEALEDRSSEAALIQRRALSGSRAARRQPIVPQLETAPRNWHPGFDYAPGRQTARMQQMVQMLQAMRHNLLNSDGQVDRPTMAGVAAAISAVNQTLAAVAQKRGKRTLNGTWRQVSTDLQATELACAHSLAQRLAGGPLVGTRSHWHDASTSELLDSVFAWLGDVATDGVADVATDVATDIDPLLLEALLVRRVELRQQAEAMRLPTVLLDASGTGAGKTTQLLQASAVSGDSGDADADGDGDGERPEPPLFEGQKLIGRGGALLFVSASARDEDASHQELLGAFSSPPVRHGGIESVGSNGRRRRVKGRGDHQLDLQPQLTEAPSCLFATEFEAALAAGQPQAALDTFCKGSCPHRPVEMKERVGEDGKVVTVNMGGDGSCAYPSLRRSFWSRLLAGAARRNLDEDLRRLRLTPAQLLALMELAPELVGRSLVALDEVAALTPLLGSWIQLDAAGVGRLREALPGVLAQVRADAVHGPAERIGKAMQRLQRALGLPGRLGQAEARQEWLETLLASGTDEQWRGSGFSSTEEAEQALGKAEARVEALQLQWALLRPSADGTPSDRLLTLQADLAAAVAAWRTPAAGAGAGAGEPKLGEPELGEPELDSLLVDLLTALEKVVGRARPAEAAADGRYGLGPTQLRAELRAEISAIVAACSDGAGGVQLPAAWLAMATNEGPLLWALGQETLAERLDAIERLTAPAALAALLRSLMPTHVAATGETLRLMPLGAASSRMVLELFVPSGAAERLARAAQTVVVLDATVRPQEVAQMLRLPVVDDEGAVIGVGGIAGIAGVAGVAGTGTGAGLAEPEGLVVLRQEGSAEAVPGAQVLELVQVPCLGALGRWRRPALQAQVRGVLEALRGASEGQRTVVIDHAPHVELEGPSAADAGAWLTSASRGGNWAADADQLVLVGLPLLNPAVVETQLELRTRLYGETGPGSELMAREIAHSVAAEWLQGVGRLRAGRRALERSERPLRVIALTDAQLYRVGLGIPVVQRLEVLVPEVAASQRVQLMRQVEGWVAQQLVQGELLACDLKEAAAIRDLGASRNRLLRLRADLGYESFKAWVQAIDTALQVEEQDDTCESDEDDWDRSEGLVLNGCAWDAA